MICKNPKNLPQLTKKNQMRQQIPCECSARLKAGGDNARYPPHWKGRWSEPQDRLTSATRRCSHKPTGSARMCHSKWKYNVSTRYRVDSHVLPEKGGYKVSNNFHTDYMLKS